jgi:hypothetical protein
MAAAGVIVGYALGAWLVLWPLPLASSGRLPGDGAGDPTQQVWWLALARWEVTTGHLSFLTDKIYVPTGVNVLDNASVPILGVLAAPLTALVGPVVVFDIALRLAFVLSATVFYLVLRRLDLSRAGSFLGGLLYGFSPYMVHAGRTYVFLALVPLPPLIFLLVYEHLRRAAHDDRPGFVETLWRGSLIGLIVVAQFFISAEIALTTALVLTCTLAVVGLSQLRHPRRLVVYLTATAGLSAVVAAIAGPLLAYPAWVLLDGPQHVARGLQHTPGIDWSRVIWPEDRGFAAWLLPHVHLSGVRSLNAEGYLVGIPMILLAAVAAIVCRKSVLAMLALTAAGIAFVLALGPHLVHQGVPDGISLPLSWLDGLPGLAQVGATRITLYFWMGLAVLVSVAVDGWLPPVVASVKGWRVEASAGLLAARVCGLVLVAGALAYLCPITPARTAAVGAAPAAMLRMIPSGGVVLAYPFPRYPEDEAMLWQSDADMRFSLIGGYSYEAAPFQHSMLKGAVRRSFTRAALGAHPSAAAAIAAERELPSLVRRYDVSTIVVDVQNQYFVRPNRRSWWRYPVRVVEAVYGKPVHAGGFDVWRVGAVRLARRVTAGRSWAQSARGRSS